jgi:hypothetical protein
MSANTIEPLQNLVQNANRGPSDIIWGNCPVLDIIECPERGMYMFDDFIGAPNIPTAASVAIAQGFNGNFSVYADIASTLTDGAAEGGVLTFNNTTTAKGITLGPSAGAFRLITTSTNAPNGKLWFEARVTKNSITATKGEMFVGLMDSFLTSGLPTVAMPISATPNVLSTVPNLIGFHFKGNAPTDVNFVYQLAGGTAVYPTNLTTLLATTTPPNVVLAASAFIKVGFLFDPQAQFKTIASASTGQTAGNVRRALLRIFVNGVELPAFLTTDNTAGAAFPTGFMGPVFAMMQQTSSSPPTAGIDWIRCCQLAYT